jgi:hypothetical protein
MWGGSRTHKADGDNMHIFIDDDDLLEGVQWPQVLQWRMPCFERCNEHTEVPETFCLGYTVFFFIESGVVFMQCCGEGMTLSFLFFLFFRQNQLTNLQQWFGNKKSDCSTYYFFAHKDKRIKTLCASSNATDSFVKLENASVWLSESILHRFIRSAKPISLLSLLNFTNERVSLEPTVMTVSSTQFVVWSLGGNYNKFIFLLIG